jgi:nitrate/nitrite transporter NarK
MSHPSTYLGIKTPHQALKPINIESDSHLRFRVLGFHTASAICRHYPDFSQLRDVFGINTGRRQIFVVFAGFLMVEKFGFSAANIALLFLVNHVVNAVLAPKIGHLIARFGERRMMTIEYVGLIIIFTAYAIVDVAWAATLLYILDHILFAMAIAIRSYFQKIADPADIASTAGVSFTVNHIAAVVIPASFGIIWLVSPSAVFLAGAFMAIISLLLSRLVPNHPEQGNEVKHGGLFAR